MIIASISLGFSEIPSHISVLIYTQGCHLHCPGCFNEELWPSTSEKAVVVETPQALENLIKSTIDINICGENPWIVWLGGDPVEQEDLPQFLEYLQKAGYNNCVYTGRTLDKVSETVIDWTDIIKVGPWEGIPVTEVGTNQKFFCNFGVLENKTVLREMKWHELQDFLKNKSWNPRNLHLV